MAIIIILRHRQGLESLCIKRSKFVEWIMCLIKKYTDEIRIRQHGRIFVEQVPWNQSGDIQSINLNCGIVIYKSFRDLRLQDADLCEDFSYHSFSCGTFSYKCCKCGKVWRVFQAVMEGPHFNRTALNLFRLLKTPPDDLLYIALFQVWLQHQENKNKDNNKDTACTDKSRTAKAAAVAALQRSAWNAM